MGVAAGSMLVGDDEGEALQEPCGIRRVTESRVKGAEMRVTKEGNISIELWKQGILSGLS